MTRAARRRNPAPSRCAMMRPAFPLPNASGLRIARVMWPAMESLRSDELTKNVAAREKADELAQTHDRNPLDVLVDHQRDDLGERLFRGDAEHLSGHDVADAAPAIGCPRLRLRDRASEHD